MTGPALDIQGLTKAFQAGFIPRRVEVLKGLDLRVERGEIFGFLGPNGAGKTTTIKIAMGLIRPGGGTVEVLGVPAARPEARRSVGFLPEQPYFYDYLTVDELFRFTAHLFGLPRSETRTRIEECIERLDLGRVRSRPLRKLSKGWMQRVGLGQALVNDPDLLVLDEPMSGLDPVGRRDFRQLLGELRDQGKTIFFSSHILSDAELLCDRVAVLAGGRTAYTGSLADYRDAGPASVELVLEGVGTDLLEESDGALRAEERGGVLTLWLETAEAADRVLRRALERGGHVRSLSTRHPGLEEIFERVVEGDGEGGGAS